MRLAIVLGAASLAACVSVDESHLPRTTQREGGTSFPVVGLSGWLPGRSVSFGDFVASGQSPLSTRTQVVACPTGCSHWRLGPARGEVESRSASSTTKLDFIQRDRQGLEAHVRAFEQQSRDSRQWLSVWFGVPVDAGGSVTVVNTLSGTIEIAAPVANVWKFALVEQASAVGADAAVGWAADDAGHRVVLKHREASDIAAQQRLGQWLPNRMPGYVIEEDGQVVGAVDEAGPRAVWIRDDMSADRRLLVASLASTLLMRHVNS